MADRLFDSLVSVRPSAAQKITIVNGAPPEPAYLELGLSIVRLIVELHRGKPQASNLADGSGVKFSLELHSVLPRPLAGVGAI